MTKINIYSSFSSKETSNRQISITQENLLKNLPTPQTDIPSISVIPPEDNGKPKKIERSKSKTSTLRIDNKKTMTPYEGMALRNAHSTGQLHTAYQTKNMACMLSTDSICSETKKKKKWPSKIFKKVFSRSSCKLQEA